MKFKSAILVAALLFSLPACAYPIMSVVYGPPFIGPVLNDVTISFGNLTPSGRGGVRLSAVDNSSYGYHFKGIDIYASGNPPASWTVTQTGGTAGHWTLPAANTVEGATAITPVPSAAGVTAHLNGGPYTFSITAKDALGNISVAKVLTVNIVANAVNIGTTDALATAFPAGFGSSTGYQVFLSTGIDRTGIRNQFKSTCAFANPVTFTHADVARPGGLLNAEFLSCSNWIINDITLTGDLNSAPSLSGLFFFNNCSDMEMNRDSVIFTQAMWRASTPKYSVISFSGITNFTATDISADWMANGIVENAFVNSNVTFHNLRLRHIFNNFVFLNSGINFAFYDTLFVSPMRRDSDHIDTFQIANGATPTNLIIHRLMAIQADGNSSAQGPPFGGTASQYSGCHIDDGAGSAGTILTCTSAPAKAAWALRAIITGVGVTPGTRIVSKTSGTTWVVDTSQLVASAGTPITMYSQGTLANASIDGLFFNGVPGVALTWPGDSGTTVIKNFTFLKTNPQNPYIATIPSATIAGTLLTVNTASPGIAGVQAGMTLNYSGCSYCANGIISSLLTGSAYTAPSTYRLRGSPGNITALAISASADAPVTFGTEIIVGNVDTAALHTGTVSLSSGYMWDFYLGQYSGGTTACTIPTACALPTNLTQANVTYGGLTKNGAAAASAVAASAFSNGDPEITLEAISAAAWAAKTIDQVVSTVIAEILPKTGGPLDAGGGNWYGAFKQDGTWNDNAATNIITTESGTTITTESGSSLTIE